MTLTNEIAALINRHSVENASNTPDFLLAEYLLACLDAYERVTQGRDAWYAMNPEPGVEWAKNVPEQPVKQKRTAEPDYPGDTCDGPAGE